MVDNLSLAHIEGDLSSSVVVAIWAGRTSGEDFPTMYEKVFGYARCVTEVLLVPDAIYPRETVDRIRFRKLKARDVTAQSAEELAELMADMNQRRSIEGTARLRRKDGTVGEIDYVVVQGSVGGLPVLVSVTAPIHEFALDS
jgi:hypothetical protein